MITTRRNDFYYVDGYAHVPCLGIETDRLVSCIEGVKTLNAKGVFCSPYHRFQATDLSFLSSMPEIEAVLLRDTTLLDIEGLYTLNQLVHFRGNERRPPIDFSRLSGLKALVFEPVSRDSGFESLSQLETLHLRNYRPYTRDFSQFHLPQSITELQLEWVTINSLKVLPPLPKLKRLEIHHCKNLEDLALELEQYPELEHLVVHACINVPEHEVERARMDFSRIPSLSIEEGEEH